MTALIFASDTGCVEVVQALLAAGADKEAKDMVGGQVIAGMAVGLGGVIREEGSLLLRDVDVTQEMIS